MVTINAGPFKLRVAFDCKCYKRKVNVTAVERMLSTLDDIRVNKGVLVTTRGYSKAALARAQNDSRDIELRIVSPDRLSVSQWIGGMVAHYGSLAALLKTPRGWVFDDTGYDEGMEVLFWIYPVGHTLESALAGAAIMYGIIIPKDPTCSRIEEIAGRDEQAAKQKFPTARFDRLPFPSKSHLSGRSALLRKGLVHAGYRGPEYSLYLDHPEGVLLLVLLCPDGRDEEFLPVLLDLGSGAILLKTTTIESK